MKKIAKLMFVCMAAFAMMSLVSCDSKVNKKELDKKILKAMDEEKMPEFTDAEYQFMVDYLMDNYDEINKISMDVDEEDKDAMVTLSYMFILADADYEGKLSKEAKKKYELLQEKMKSSDEYKAYKENEKAIMKALEEADIDWEQAFAEEEAVIDYYDDAEAPAEAAVAEEVVY